MSIQALEPILFRDISHKPVFNISSCGDVFFCAYSYSRPRANECTLFILKQDEKILQASFPGVPISDYCYRDLNYATNIKNNDSVHLTLHVNPYSPGEKGCWVKTDLYGRAIWKKEIAGCPVHSAITTTGKQFIFYFKLKDSEFRKLSGVLSLLSEDGKELWSINDKWLNNTCTFYMLPGDLLVIFTAPKNPNLAGLMSRLYIVDTSGRVVKCVNTLPLAKEYGMHYTDVQQSPGCYPQENLVFIPDDSVQFDYVNLIPKYYPQHIGLYNPLTEEFQLKEFPVSAVKAFLWDERKRTLYISSEKKGTDVARILFDNDLVDYYSLPQVKHPKPQYTADSSCVSWNYNHHCTPVLCKNGDIIFCNSATSILCMSEDWKQKWSMTLPEGACDIKMYGDILYVMLYDEDVHTAILYRFRFT